MSRSPLVLISADRGIPKTRLDKLAVQSGLQLAKPGLKPDFFLHLTQQRLELRKPDYTDKQRPPRFTVIAADFVSGKARHRRLQGGGKGQDIAKAIGLNKIKSPRVLDLTAGLGRDAFVLATLGCHVTMVERHAVVYALLKDALDRATLSSDEELQTILTRLSLQQARAEQVLDALDSENPDSLPDVIYLDPMFPERDKSAQVKKEMAFFHQLVGQDNDAEQLLLLSLGLAKKRIVVKRPRLAPKLTGTVEPAFVVSGKSTRYDVYLPVRIATNGTGNVSPDR